MKSFEKWKTEELERTFGVAFKRKMLSMEQWLGFQQELTQKQSETSEELRLFLLDFADFWNEADIKAFFILPIIQLVNFYAFEKYRIFLETTFQAELLTAKNEACILRGRVEMVVATGKQDPQTPFFFLNEYKPQIKAVSDPKGQLLSTMLAAQAKNNALNLPIYGLYTIGQLWFFVILEGKEYSVSPAFDATKKDDLQQIISMLGFVKKHIEANI